MISEISEEKIKEFLSGNMKKYCFEIHDEIDSTNARAKQLYAQGTDRAVVVSDMQTKGRGRLGRSFYSPKGSGIYMSILFKADREPADAVKVTTFAAVAAARAIERMTGIKAGIKWVNDIYINEKKVCGILTEAGFSAEGSGVDYVVAGIGINVYGKEFPEHISNIATSLEAEMQKGDLKAEKSLDRNRLIAEILKEIEPFVIGEAADYIKEYKAKSIILGRKVNVIRGGEEYQATAIDIDDNCGLIVETENHHCRRVITAGEVSIRIKK